MSIHISASLINDFLKCNKMVFYRINRPDLAIQNKEMVIGEIVHKAIEKFWRDDRKAEEFTHKELDFRLPNDYSAVKFSDDCLQTFFHIFRQYLLEGDSIERKFKIPYEPDVFIVGKLDRISNHSVFDWKTARKPPKDISDDIQFILYNWAYKRLFDMEPVGVYYAALTNGNLIKYRQDMIAENVLFSDLIPQILYAIRKGDFTPNGLFRGACYRCSFANHCLKELERHVVDSTASSKK